MECTVPVKYAPPGIVSRHRQIWTSLIRASLWCLVLVVLLPQPALTLDLSYTIREQQPDGTLIGNVEQDFGQGHNSGSNPTRHYIYTITGGQNSGHFRINSATGDLATNGVLDREVLCPGLDACNLGFEVNRVSGFGSQAVNVVVSLQDINDNSPVFSQSQVTLTVPESATPGERYALPQAMDIDTGPRNSIQSYSLSPANSQEFQLQMRSGLGLGSGSLYLVVYSQLDYEAINRYDLVLTARDGGNEPGPRQGSINITVLVEDVNDNAPQFEHSRYTVQLNTSTANHSLIATLRAVDRDQGVNGAVQYRLAATQHPASIAHQFHVDSQTGDVTNVQPLPAGQHEVVVEAVDGGTPALASQAVLEVNVVAVRNTRPVITLNLFSSTGHPWVNINEMASVGSAVAHVAVADPDQGPNGVITCFLADATFGLQPLAPDEFLVMLASNLDRELQASYDVIITCSDAGYPPETASQALHIRVGDVNDNAPVLSAGNNITVSVQENNNIGALLTQIEATDADVGVNAEISFSLLNDFGGAFQILPGSNHLVCNTRLDREMYSTYVLRVLVHDHGVPPQSTVATVRINVQDVNDNPPQFPTGNYRFSVVEESPPQGIIGMVVAYDQDMGENSYIDYSILSSPEEHQNFQINANGYITTHASFDRENVSVHHFSVVATDRGTPGLLSVAQVEVEVIDVNDNPPVFMFPIPGSPVNLSLPVVSSQAVAVMQAYDADEGGNAVIHYSLADQTSPLFQLDQFSGELFTARALTSQDVGVHNLTIRAEDGGTPTLTTTTMLTIIVNNE